VSSHLKAHSAFKPRDQHFEYDLPGHPMYGCMARLKVPTHTQSIDRSWDMRWRWINDLLKRNDVERSCSRFLGRIIPINAFLRHENAGCRRRKTYGHHWTLGRLPCNNENRSIHTYLWSTFINIDRNMAQGVAQYV